MIVIPDEKSFVDTNILVYAFEKGQSEKKRTAERLMSELMRRDLLRLSTQILQELFVTLTRKGDPRYSGQEELAILEELSAWPLVLIDYPAIKTAFRLAEESKISFWDALMIVAAARTGATVLYTEDLNHGQVILGIRICNPFAA